MQWYCKIVYLSVLLVFSLESFANSNLILTPLNKQGLQELKLLRNNVEKMTDVFSPSEQLFLEKNHRLTYAAKKVTVKNYSMFLQWSKQKLPHVGIERLTPITPMFSRDPLFVEQWGLDNLGFRQVINISDVDVVTLQGRKGIDIGFSQLPPERSKKIIVAILDTGIDYSHPDLKGAIFHSDLECDALLKYERCLQEKSQRECDRRWANYDADGNGYPLDCAGWNVLGNGSPLSRVKGNNDASDTIGHGTHIAGIIAARNNDIGIVGIAQQVKILPVKVMGDVKSATADDHLPGNLEDDLPPIQTYADFFARGLLYAIRSGAQIINMSLGWSRGVDSVLMHDLVRFAQEKGILIVAAAGNDSTDYPIYPCIYDGVICVGAYSADGTISHFSNFGASVDIMAPGQKILSAWPMKLSPMYYTERKGYEFKNGTSMAAPFVVGALARLLNAGFSSEEARARLLAGTMPSQPYYLEQGVEKFGQSGNLNLANSFTVKPHPYFISVKKAPIYLVWNGESTKLDFTIKLKNIWADAKKVTAHLSLQRGAKDAVLTKHRFNFLEVKHNTQVTLNTSLQLNDRLVGSEYVIAIKLQNGDGQINTVYRQLEIILPLTPKRHHPHEKIIALKEQIDTSQTNVNSFVTLSDHRYSSLLLSKKERNGLHFQILQVDLQQQQSHLSAPLAVRMLPNQVAGVWQLDFDLDGQLDYVIAQRMLKTVRERGGHKKHSTTGNQFVFYFFNKDFSPKQVTLLGQTGARIVYDNKHAVLGKDFIWIKNGAQLAPCWMGKGDDLVTQSLPYDPWEPELSTKKGTFVYYLGKDKLEALKLDSNYKLISLQSMGNFSGELTYAQGKNFSYQFFKMTIDDLQDFFPSTFQELLFLQHNQSHYLMIGDLQESRVFAEDNTIFTDIDSRGNLYVGVSNGERGEIFNLANNTLIDPLHAMAGGFRVGAHYQFWTIGKYQLKLFQDEQFIAQTTLKRFSFMPGLTFDQFLYPVEVSDPTLGPTAIYFPGGLGVSLSSEIITLRKHVGKIFRPALYRIFATKGCVELNHQTVGHKTDLVFLCPQSIRFISL